MSSDHQRRMTDERGSVLISGLLFSVALLIMIGAAVDISHAFIIRRHLVSLADQAALSGSQALDLDAVHAGRIALDPQQAQQVALEATAAEARVRTRAQASTGAIRVEVERQFPTVLLRLVGLSQLTVKAQATAAPRQP